MTGYLDLRQEVTLAAGVNGTQLLVQFHQGLIVEDQLLNLYQQESSRLENLGLCSLAAAPR